MAKKKTNKGKGQEPFSVKRYLKERMRQVPIGKCYIDNAWKDCGETNVIVTRQHKQGTITCGIYLVDTYCLGVKKSIFKFNQSEDEFNENLEQMKQNAPEFKEVSYEEAHNLIWGAVAFAEEGGIKPDESFSLTQYILEEDTDDIPLIEYDFGRNGQHFLIANSSLELTKYLPSLRKTLGDDFDISISQETEDNQEYKWNDNVVSEAYNYDAPSYPKKLKLNYRQELDVLNDERYTHRLPDEIIDGLLSLDREQLREDLENILLYSANYGRMNINIEWGLTFHAFYLIAEVGNDQSMDVVMETLRQDMNYMEQFTGDITNLTHIPTLTKLCCCNLEFFKEYLHTPGMCALNREIVLETVANIIEYYPEKREEIVAWWHELLAFYTENLANTYCCDSSTAAFAISAVMHSGLKELADDVEKLFATGLVRDEICGKEQDVMEELLSGIDTSRPYSLDIKERYKELSAISKFFQKI